MAITITTLSDNCVAHPDSSAKGLLGEHGLAFLVQAKGRNILFDTGTGATILPNGDLLNVPWNSIDALVLSHGHQDHTGGLEKVLGKTGPVTIPVHPDIFKTKVIVSEGGERRTALLKTKGQYEERRARFITKEESMELAQGILLVGPVGRRKPSDDERMPHRFLQEGEHLIPDPFNDEQFLALDTPQGLLLLLGCTHNGIRNTIDKALEITGKQQIHTIIGGLHLCNAHKSRVKELALYFKELNLKQFIPCHCTGLEAAAIFRETLGDTVSFNYVGNKVSFGG